jgi:hypothetical protein
VFGLFKRKLPENEPLDLVFIPPLVLLLLNKEKEKGSPLTQSEVEGIRDAAICVSMRRSLASKMENARGYPDLDSERTWDDWSQRRAALLSRRSDA